MDNNNELNQAYEYLKTFFTNESLSKAEREKIANTVSALMKQSIDSIKKVYDKKDENPIEKNEEYIEKNKKINELQDLMISSSPGTENFGKYEINNYYERSKQFYEKTKDNIGVDDNDIYEQQLIEINRTNKLFDKYLELTENKIRPSFYTMLDCKVKDLIKENEDLSKSNKDHKNKFFNNRNYILLLLRVGILLSHTEILKDPKIIRVYKNISKTVKNEGDLLGCKFFIDNDILVLNGDYHINTITEFIQSNEIWESSSEFLKKKIMYGVAAALSEMTDKSTSYPLIIKLLEKQSKYYVANLRQLENTLAKSKIFEDPKFHTLLNKYIKKNPDSYFAEHAKLILNGGNM